MGGLACRRPAPCALHGLHAACATHPASPPADPQLYKPLEFLFLVAAFTTLAENFLPQLMSLPKSIVQTVVRSTLSLTFVIAAARVVFNIKGR